MISFAFLVMIILVSNFFESGLTAQPVIIDGEVPAESGFRRVTPRQGLVTPWAMAWLPNGDLLVTERPWLFHLVKGGWLVAAPVVGVTELFAAGQGGFSAHPGVGRRIGQVVKTEFLTLKMVLKRGYT